MGSRVIWLGIGPICSGYVPFTQTLGLTTVFFASVGCVGGRIFQRLGVTHWMKIYYIALKNPGVGWLNAVPMRQNFYEASILSVELASPGQGAICHPRIAAPVPHAPNFFTSQAHFSEALSQSDHLWWLLQNLVFSKKNLSQKPLVWGTLP